MCPSCCSQQKLPTTPTALPQQPSNNCLRSDGFKQGTKKMIYKSLFYCTACNEWFRTQRFKTTQTEKPMWVLDCGFEFLLPLGVCVCVGVCVCAFARLCVCVCVYVCDLVFVNCSVFCLDWNYIFPLMDPRKVRREPRVLLHRLPWVRHGPTVLGWGEVMLRGVTWRSEVTRWGDMARYEGVRLGCHHACWWEAVFLNSVFALIIMRSH